LPKKIENPLRQGLPSRIYYYSFAKPINGNSIARAVYKPKGRPETAKIYPTAKKMVEGGLLTVADKKYQSRPEKLVEEIKKELTDKKITLTDSDKKRVLKLLQCRFFKEIIASEIEKEPKNRKPQDIDAAQQISSILAITCIPIYQQFRQEEKEIGAMYAHEKTKFIGYIDQEPFKETTTQDPITEFLFYLQPRLASKLVRLLPADLPQVWDSFEEVLKKISTEANKP
jgi:DNA-binding PadR family transcriptional regulator